MLKKLWNQLEIFVDTRSVFWVILVVILMVGICVIIPKPPPGRGLIDLGWIGAATNTPGHAVEWLPTEEIVIPATLEPTATATVEPTATSTPTPTPTPIPDFWKAVRDCDIDSVLTPLGNGGYILHYFNSLQVPKAFSEDEIYGKIAIEGLYEIEVGPEVLVVNDYGIFADSRTGLPVHLRDPLLCKEPLHTLRWIYWESDWQIVDDRKITLKNGSCSHVTLEQGSELDEKQLRTLFWWVRAEGKGVTWISQKLHLGAFEWIVFNDQSELEYLFAHGKNRTFVKTQKAIPLNTEMLLTTRNCQNETERKEVRFFLYGNDGFKYLIQYTD